MKFNCLDIYYTKCDLRHMVPRFYQIYKIDEDEIYLANLPTESVKLKEEDNLIYTKHTPKIKYGGNFYQFDNNGFIEMIEGERRTKCIDPLDNSDTNTIYTKDASLKELIKWEGGDIITVHGVISR